MVQIEVTQGDITVNACQAIVNAANSSLLGGGGVDGAIHRAAGPTLLDECRAIVARQGGCQPGDAVITGAGELAAEYVIHTVGPIWGDSNGDELDLVLASCYAESLQLAADHDVVSVAFPNVSTGVYGYPLDRAAPVAIGAVRTFVDSMSPQAQLERIEFVCFDPENFEIYSKLLNAEVTS